MILKFSLAYYKALLAWYYSQIFCTSSAALAFLDLPPVVRKDVDNVDDLIQRMNNTDIVQIGTLSNSPSLAPSTSHGSISTTMAPNRPSPTPAFGSSAAPVAVAPHDVSPISSPCRNVASDSESVGAVENNPRCEPIPVPVVEQEVHEGIDVGVIQGNRRATRGTTVMANYIAQSTRNTIQRSKGKN
ncbi:hypothetical protein EI94DRAFT_1701735 [Lactarius quietus]|nr:hypothetical protein EI94DRAFT_1701735 [Lactarius quietus]